MANYNPQKIEPKWQRYWQEQKFFEAKDFSKKQKLYLLVEFPYPSAEGLHVGHCRSYVAMDIIARKKRMEGFNVLFPMGWDAFGLPTENYALRTGAHPKIVTAKNTANFKRQLKSLGLSFDWSREINTTDPDYYKWTQWIFLKFFEKGLAYKAKMPVNWCPSCKIVLANEEVINECCERCGASVEKKEKEQWLLKITKYADRLIKDLDLVDFPEKVKALQKDWIGRSVGAYIKFPVLGADEALEVYTTRIDTIFSGTFLILAPEHKFVKKYQEKIKNRKEVQTYCEATRHISEIERTAQAKDWTGVELQGIKAVNPATNEEMPVWIADFVMASYGTGAVFADAHDKRDFDLAKKYGLPLKVSLRPPDEKLFERVKNFEECYEDDGILFNSDQFDGLTSAQARPKIIAWLGKKGLARAGVNFKLRDWIFSRQHYWGEPIPMINCQKCGWVPVPEKDLPVKLPEVEKYQPTDTGESPLANIKEWVNVACPECGGAGRRETDTMPNWAGSNWYYLRYCDPQNDKCLADPKKLKYWMTPARRSSKSVGGVDWYNGGMEHTTLHLLYSRFCYKVLFDIGAVPTTEPYKKRTSHGMILGEGGIKMSKSKGNVINPDEVVKDEGADTLRVYEMFMGPFGEAINWDKKGVKGVRRFLDKVWQLSEQFISINQPKSASISGLKRELHKTIKKVGEDIENLKFNTAVSALMILTNEMEKQGNLSVKIYETFLKLLAPFAPHMAEELWRQRYIRVNQRSNPRKSASIFLEKWPKYEPKFVKEERITLVIQINGKVRDKIEVESDISEKKAKELALSQEKIQKWLVGKEIKKVIFVAGKLINLVAIDKK